jgi:hypothetical protein
VARYLNQGSGGYMAAAARRNLAGVA